MESAMEIEEAPPIVHTQPQVGGPESGGQVGVDAAKTQSTATEVVVSSQPGAIQPVSTSSQGGSAQTGTTPSGVTSAAASNLPQPSVTSNPGPAVAPLYTNSAGAANNTPRQAGIGGFPAIAAAPMVKQSVLDAWAQQPPALIAPPPVPRSSLEKRGWLPPPTGLQAANAPRGVTAPNQPFHFPKVPAVVNPSQEAAVPSKRGRPRKEKLATPPVVETPFVGGVNLGWPATEQPPLPAPVVQNDTAIRGVPPGQNVQATAPLQQGSSNFPTLPAATATVPPPNPAAHATPQQQSMLPNVLFAEWYIQRLGWLANALMNRPRPKEEVRDIPCGIFLTALENDGILRVQNDLNLKSFSHVVGAVGSGTLLDDILRSHTAIVVDMLQRQETERKEALELLTHSQEKIAHLEMELRTATYRLSSEQDVTKRLMNALRTIQAAGLTPAQQSALGGLSNLFENPSTLKRAREVNMPGLAGMTGVVEIVDLDPDLGPSKRGPGRPRRDEIIPKRNLNKNAATPTVDSNASGLPTPGLPNPNPDPTPTSNPNPVPNPPVAAPPVSAPTTVPLAKKPLPEPARNLPAVVPAVNAPLAATPAVTAPPAASPPNATSGVFPAAIPGTSMSPVSAASPALQPTTIPLSSAQSQSATQAPSHLLAPPLIPLAPGLGSATATGLPNPPTKSPGLPNPSATNPGPPATAQGLSNPPSNLQPTAPGLLNLPATPPLFKPVAPSITSAALANIAPAPPFTGPIHPGSMGPAHTGSMGPVHTGGLPPMFDLPQRTTVQLSNGRGPKMTSFFPIPEKLTVEEAARRAALPPFFAVPEKTSVEEANRSVQPAPLSEEALNALRAGFVLPERVSLSVLEGSRGGDVEAREASVGKAAPAVATPFTGVIELRVTGPSEREATERDGDRDVDMTEAVDSPDDDVIIRGVDMGPTQQGVTVGGSEAGTITARKSMEDVPAVESEPPAVGQSERVPLASGKETGAVEKSDERKDDGGAADKASALDVSTDQNGAEKVEALSLDGSLPGAGAGTAGTEGEGGKSPVKSPGHKSEAPQTPLRRSGRHK